jgi:hypothetical protein
MTENKFFFCNVGILVDRLNIFSILNSKINSQFDQCVQVLGILDVVSGINYRSNKNIKVLKSR